jgi:hypothetical protein
METMADFCKAADASKYNRSSTYKSMVHVETPHAGQQKRMEIGTYLTDVMMVKPTSRAEKKKQGGEGQRLTLRQKQQC